jgi:hypothetical protein
MLRIVALQGVADLIGYGRCERDRGIARASIM